MLFLLRNPRTFSVHENCIVLLNSSGRVKSCIVYGLTIVVVVEKKRMSDSVSYESFPPPLFSTILSLYVYVSHSKSFFLVFCIFSYIKPGVRTRPTPNYIFIVYTSSCTYKFSTWMCTSMIRTFLLSYNNNEILRLKTLYIDFFF